MTNRPALADRAAVQPADKAAELIGRGAGPDRRRGGRTAVRELAAAVEDVPAAAGASAVAASPASGAVDAAASGAADAVGTAASDALAGEAPARHPEVGT